MAEAPHVFSWQQADESDESSTSGSFCRSDSFTTAGEGETPKFSLHSKLPSLNDLANKSNGNKRKADTLNRSADDMPPPAFARTENTKTTEERTEDKTEENTETNTETTTREEQVEHFQPPQHTTVTWAGSVPDDTFQPPLNLGSAKKVPRRGSLFITTKMATASEIGTRPYMEDFSTTVGFGNKKEVSDGSSATSRSNCTEDYAFFGVFDGHGGQQCANFVAEHLHNTVVNHPSFETDTEMALREAFINTETDYATYSKSNQIRGDKGSTACVGLIVKGTLWVANVGDSAALLCQRGNPVRLTTPHTPKVSSERQRVIKAGGIITKNERLGHPLYNPDMMNIAVTRSFGDFLFKHEEHTGGKPSGLIAEPDIISTPLTNYDYFLLLASDGFWDVIDEKIAIRYIIEQYREDVDTICKGLLELVKQKAPKKRMDNTTVLLVKLSDAETVTGQLNP